MIIIPINPVTVPLIQELNNGVAPEIQGETYFVWFEDQPARIISKEENEDIIYGDNPVMKSQSIHIRVGAV